MIQRGGGARLPLEALQRRRIPGETGRKELEGHNPIEACVASFVHLAHSTSPEKLQHNIRSDLFPWSHGWPACCLLRALVAGFQETCCQLVIEEQRFDFTKELLISAARTFEIGPPLFRLPLPRGMVQSFNFGPPFG